MTRRCSCPGCTEEAVWKVTAQNAGSRTGKTFYTCDRHGLESDDRVPLGAEA